VLVPPAWSIVQTHDVLDEIEAELGRLAPGIQVLTHPEPATGGIGARESKQRAPEKMPS